jgi:hypothetical protein
VTILRIPQAMMIAIAGKEGQRVRGPVVKEVIKLYRMKGMRKTPTMKRSLKVCLLRRRIIPIMNNKQ